MPKPKPDLSRAFFAIPDGMWDGPIVAAFKAINKGEARGDQQQIALKFLLGTLCENNHSPFRPDARETDFALGKQWVAQQVLRLIAEPFERLTGKQTTGEKP